MAQLVDALRYKPEGRGFDSRLCHWNFSASNRHYQEYFLGSKGGRCIGPPLCADCLEIWLPEPRGNLRACPGLYTDWFTLQD